MDTYQTILGEEPSEPVENLRLTRAVIEGWLANDVIEKQQRGELLATLYPRRKRDRFLVTCWLGLVAVFFLSGGFFAALGFSPGRFPKLFLFVCLVLAILNCYFLFIIVPK